MRMAVVAPRRTPAKTTRQPAPERIAAQAAAKENSRQADQPQGENLSCANAPEAVYRTRRLISVTGSDPARGWSAVSPTCSWKARTPASPTMAATCVRNSARTVSACAPIRSIVRHPVGLPRMRNRKKALASRLAAPPLIRKQVERVAPPPTQRAPLPQARQNLRGGTMARILVVDDTPISVQLMNLTLTKQGHEVRSADNGAQGVAAAKEWRPDLVIMDVMTPEMAGHEPPRRIRANTPTAFTPIIVVTAQDTLEEKMAAFAAGADYYMSNPVEPVELSARVEVHRKRAFFNDTATSEIRPIAAGFVLAC